MAQELNVAVIGGGYAGMAAAAALARRRINVTVHESARQLGGRARGLQRHDTQLDNGQHILLGCYHQTLQMIEQVGGNVDQDFLRLPLQLVLQDRFELKAPALPAPLHLLLGLLSASGLTFKQRMSAARFMLSMRRNQFVIAHDITALQLLQTQAQDADLIRLLWEPICVAALNTPLAQASAQVLLNVLRDSLNGSRADSDLLLPRIDFSTLFPDRAARYVERHGGKVQLSSSVQAIVPQAQGFRLQTATGELDYSHVICAASSAQTAQLLAPTAELAELAGRIRTLKFQPIYTVYLQYPAQISLPHPMLGFDQGLAQWVFDKGRISGQHGLIATVISAEGSHQDLDHETFALRTAQELTQRLKLDAAPLWHQVIAEKRATFHCAPNLDRPSNTTALKGLYIAGDYTEGDYPATLEGAIISGLNCAAEIK